MPKLSGVVDIRPKNLSVVDVKPNMTDKGSGLQGETTQSFSVAHTAGVLMLIIPFITYPSSGTETQWSESGGIF